MIHKAFTGSTMAEAFQKAKREYGEHVLVVTSKEIKKKTPFSPALYEVVVAVDENKFNNSKNSEQKSTTQEKLTNAKPNRSLDEGVMLQISDTVKEISQIANMNSMNAQTQIPIQKQKNNKNDSANSEDINEIKKEIMKLADRVNNIQNMIWEDKSEIRGDLPIPPEFAQIYKVARKSGMSKEHLDSIMKLTIELMPNKMKENTQTVRRYFKTLLRRMIPIRHEPKFQKNMQKIIMLVGPTGVGKTTTLAKLAAKYAYVNTIKHKVGIITLDTYRIGAVEQLFQYAKMMKLPLIDVDNTDEFDQAINSLKHCEVILIDTVGSSQYDNKKLSQISSFLDRSEQEIDVNLVLSATTKLEDLRTIYNNFSFLNIDTMIFTKLDETNGFGNIFSLVYTHKKPISYFSIGQTVPDDIMVASSEYLVDCLFDGFKKDRR